MTTRAWVVGRGGLLGSAIERALRPSQTAMYVPPQPFAWNLPVLLVDQIVQATAAFADVTAAADAWEVYWAAGAGTMGSVAADLAAETNGLDALLAALRRSSLNPARGRLFVASSAGALYAGSTVGLISEETEDGPTTPYAFAKSLLEAKSRDFARETGVRTVVGRISTLYGVGQATAKPQGLLTHMARAIVRNRPIQIFVPLDTVRDYIAVDDAATMIVETARSTQAGAVVRKIIASEQPVTIAEIVATFRRVARRPPRIVTHGATTSSLYARRMQFRSIVPPFSSSRRTSLVVGVSRLLAEERSLFARPR